jgi:hypothetical protein
LAFSTQADDDDDQGLLEANIPFFGSGIGRKNQVPVINGKEEKCEFEHESN